MSEFMPLIVIALALLAAGSIAFIAWELSSKEVQDEIEKALGEPDSSKSALPNADQSAEKRSR
jgi:hypothetical protein